jgi:hypothetical protein
MTYFVAVPVEMTLATSCMQDAHKIVSQRQKVSYVLLSTLTHPLPRVLKPNTVLHTIFHSIKEHITSLFLLQSQPRSPRTCKNRHPRVLIGCTIKKVIDHGHQLEKIHLALQLHFVHSIKTNWQHSLFRENISGPSIPFFVLHSTNPV